MRKGYQVVDVLPTPGGSFSECELGDEGVWVRFLSVSATTIYWLGNWTPRTPLGQSCGAPVNSLGSRYVAYAVPALAQAIRYAEPTRPGSRHLDILFERPDLNGAGTQHRSVVFTAVVMRATKTLSIDYLLYRVSLPYIFVDFRYDPGNVSSRRRLRRFPAVHSWRCFPAITLALSLAVSGRGVATDTVFSSQPPADYTISMA